MELLNHLEQLHTAGLGVVQIKKNLSLFHVQAYITYCKPRTVSDEQREQARQRMAKINSNDN